MPCHRLLACAAALALTSTLAPLPAQAATTSVTTDLYGKSCRLVESQPRGASSTRRCAGARGYALLVHETEGRSSIDIVAPGKQAWQLDVWDVVAPGLSQVGRKAEWQMAGGAPQALLVRVDTIDTSNMVFPRTSTAIAVARIDGDGACIVFKVDANARGAEAEARKAAADRSRKCLGTYAGASLPTPL